MAAAAWNVARRITGAFAVVVAVPLTVVSAMVLWPGKSRSAKEYLADVWAFFAEFVSTGAIMLWTGTDPWAEEDDDV